MSIRIEQLVTDGYIRRGEESNPLVVMLRILALPVVRIGVLYKINPNVVTILSITLGISAALLYYCALVWVFFLTWTASVILDYADGTIARVSGKSSHFGYLLDMLGDRLKLLALILAWWQVNGTFLAGVAAAIIVAILASLEIVTHALVRHQEPRNDRSYFRRGPLLRVFFEFNMHSFFVLGVCLAVERSMDWAGILWLGVILSASLTNECKLRVLKDGKFFLVVNPNIVKFAPKLFR